MSRPAASHFGGTAITGAECKAIRALADEWTMGELTMTFQASEGVIRRHIKQRCSHSRGGRR